MLFVRILRQCWLGNSRYVSVSPTPFTYMFAAEFSFISRSLRSTSLTLASVAIVGIYYLKDVKELRAALKHLMDNDIRTRGEFQLTDALQMMIEQGCKFRTAPVREWLDCGLPETLVQTNTWLLQNKYELNNVSRAAVDQRDSIHNARLIPPCIIGKMGGAELSPCRVAWWLCFTENVKVGVGLLSQLFKASSILLLPKYSPTKNGNPLNVAT